MCINLSNCDSLTQIYGGLKDIAWQHDKGYLLARKCDIHL